MNGNGNVNGGIMATSVSAQMKLRKMEGTVEMNIPRLTDERVLRILDFLQDCNFPAYVSFKKNLEATVKMELYGSAERSFFAGDRDSYETYWLYQDANHETARYLNWKSSFETEGCHFFLHIRKDNRFPFAVVYLVGDDGYIFSKRGFCSEQTIEDIKFTFINYLIPSSYPQEFPEHTSGITVENGVQNIREVSVC